MKALPRDVLYSFSQLGRSGEISLLREGSVKFATNQLSKLRSTSSTSSSTSFSMVSGSSKKSVCYVLAPKVGDTGVAFGQVFFETTETIIFCCLLLLVLKSSSILCNAFLFLSNKKGSKMQIFGGIFREKHHFKYSRFLAPKQEISKFR